MQICSFHKIQSLDYLKTSVRESEATLDYDFKLGCYSRTIKKTYVKHPDQIRNDFWKDKKEEQKCITEPTQEKSS